MEIVRLDDENISLFSDYVPEDIAENIGRTYYRGLILTEDNRPVAGIIWFFKNNRSETDRESHIVWLEFSDDESGTVLFEEYNAIITTEGIPRSTFSLPARAAKEKRAFLKKRGFTAHLMEGDLIAARLSEVSELEVFSRIKYTGDVRPLSEMPQRAFNIAIKRMASKGFCGINEDIESLPRSYFENDVSAFYEKDGVITGLFLCHITASGKIRIEMMVCLGKDYSRPLMEMMKKSMESANAKYAPETEIIIDRHNYATQALGEKFFPTGFGIPVYVGEREEIGR